MISMRLKHALAATASAGVLTLGLGMTSAQAVPVPFQIDPDALTTSGGPFANQTVTDFQGNDNILLHQDAPGAQSGTGLVIGSQLVNGASNVSSNLSRMVTEGNFGTPSTSLYNLYIPHTVSITGITGFGGGQTGTLTDFSGFLKADIGDDDTFKAATANAGGAPAVLTGGGNDVTIATLSLISGSAGFDSNDAPFFSLRASFVVCDGNANEGYLGSQLISGGIATGCGSFDGRTFLVDPNPFYDLSLSSYIAGSSSNLTIGADGYATIGGVVLDANFLGVPEPASVLLFGCGLLGLGFFAQRRQNQKKAEAV